MARPKRKTRAAEPAEAPGAALIRLIKERLADAANPDPRSHAEFLADLRAKQAAGKLTNPATAALIDRLELAVTR